MKKKNLVILGTIVGATGVAVSTFFATKKGKEMQKHLLKKADEIQNKMKDVEMSEVKQAITTKLDEVMESINEFDWNTPKEEISTKYFELKDKLNVIKDHIDIAKVKLDIKADEIEETFDEDFTLEIDATK